MGLGIMAGATLFMLVHGTFTYRENHQKMFARSVELRINIPGISAQAENDVLTLRGQGTSQQKAFAEKIALQFMTRFADRAVNPPTSLINEIRVRGVSPAQPNTVIGSNRAKDKKIADRPAKKRASRGG